RALATFLVAQLDRAVDLRDHRRVLGTARFEELRHARQAARDVLGASRLARGLGDHRARADHLAVLDLEVGALGDGVDGDRVTLLVLEHDLRVQVALVFGDLTPDRAASGVAFDLEGLALDQVLVAHATAGLGDDRAVVRVPQAEDLPSLDLGAVRELQHGTDGDRIAVDLTAPIVDEQGLAVA